MNFLKKILNPTQTSIKTTLIITSSNGFHLRPIAKFVNEVKRFQSVITIAVNNREVSANQVPKILSLALEQGDSFTLNVKGGDASKATKHLVSFFHTLMQEDTKVEIAKQEEEHYQAPTLKGETISKGVGIAPLIKYKIIQSIDKKNSRSINEAIDLTKNELLELYKKGEENSDAQIFLAQKELLASDIFSKQFENIEEFKGVISDEVDRLKNGKFKSRISDYRDLEQRVLSHLGIKNSLKLPNSPYILLANDLLPSEVTLISKSLVQGVILQKGTVTSHASILLRSFGIPSMIIEEKVCKDLLCSYPTTILDANSGDLILEPTTKDIRKAEMKRKIFEAKQKYSFENRFNATRTKFGREVKVLANITDITSAKEAKELGADGIGLLRTEFLFTEVKPTLEEQIEAYKKIFELFEDITIRTLDIGGDKSLPYINIPKEDNPFLGLRGIRFSLYEKELFREQLLAIFKASNGKPIKIMFPMISQKGEFVEAKREALHVAERHNIDIEHIQFGIMVEVPSVILTLRVFDKEVDFFSVGTNDLTQYLFAIERTHPTLKVNPTAPEIISALKIIIDNTTKSVSICGELAGIEEVTKQLIGMGYNRLSVSPKLIPSLKEKIRLI